MKAILQYCDTVDGTFKNVGTVRYRKNKDYKVEAITDKNRQGNSETVGYQVTVNALCATLNTDFRDQDSWYFRVAFFDDLTMIALGLQYWSADYDAAVVIHGREYHLVNLTFTIGIGDYETYTVPEALPEAEGGIVIEDSDIYIE